jgi:hypothetical protein
LILVVIVRGRERGGGGVLDLKMGLRWWNVEFGFAVQN